ncbi:MAG TPA: efflux RND transporter periplasmic adaptor subunit [Candidatus Sulfotelmatobacter sp.]|nr:efflux RND transporter periplasmic adaptor subunit [Candidatus Sulfotelmatobacter sp.]
MQLNPMRHLVPIVFVLACALTACSDQNPETASAAPPAGPSPSKSSSSSADDAVTVSGPLIVEHQLDVLAQREGVIESLRADVGSRVKSGAVLAQLDDRELTADVEAAHAKADGTEAELKSWQSESKVLDADFDRAKKLWDAQLIPLEQFEHAKFKAEEEKFEVQRVQQALLTARATEHSLELELEKTRIHAPFDGVIARRYVRQGQQIARGDRLFWISGDGPLRIRFTLPERFIGKIKNGQEMVLSTPDLPNETFKGRVIEVSPVVDPASSTFEVEVALVGSRGNLRPGMNASVKLDVLQ